MGILDMFNNSNAQREKAINDILKNKAKTVLMCTSKTPPKDVYSFSPVFNKTLNKTVVFATDDEKTAILYALRPMYYFTFNQNEKAALIIGNNHSLLKLDSIVSYIYSVDNTNFEPVVSEQGKFDHEWVSNVNAPIKRDIPVKKVTFEDILKSGIQVFWIKDESIATEFDNQLKASGFTTGNQKLDFLKDQANWYPDKVVYMNAYKKIGLATQTEKGWEVPKQSVYLKEISYNKITDEEKNEVTKRKLMEKNSKLMTQPSNQAPQFYSVRPESYYNNNQNINNANAYVRKNNNGINYGRPS